MKIILLLNQSYPHGYALTKRFHLYAKGFIHKGHRAIIVIPHPTEKNNDTLNKSISEIYDDVPFQYLSASTVRSSNFFKRRHHDVMGSIKTGIFLLKEKPDVVISSAFSTVFFIYLKVISLFTSLKILRERNEVINLKEDRVSKFKLLKAGYENHLFHGAIVINQQLLSYMKNKLGDRKLNIVVPILVEDIKRKNRLPTKNTIVYTGTYQERKDGILTILESFAKINTKYLDYNLVLTGSPQRSKDYNKIVEIIAANKLEAQITFTGYLSEEELWDVLFTARMLIITKPDNRQNYYNFPTKMGEYLISGRPVISTKVGVIGEIMEDNVNIIFTSYDKTAISKKMEFVIKNPELSAKIGAEGRDYALANFNYLIHAERMLNFFSEKLKVKPQ